MTEQSSFKSFFRRYLLYKIDQQKANLVLCCILNILTLPLLALAMRKGVSSLFADLYNVGKIGAAICAVFSVFLAVAGAITSFEFYNKKNLTDTLGVLPITYKQRFFGDLISGYIANVAPVIPCGIVSLVIFSDAQKKFAASLENLNIKVDVSLMRFGVNAFVTFFFIVSITYFIAVFVTSACGKIRHSFIFSIFFLAAMPMMAGGFTGFITNSILSVDYLAAMEKAMLLFPPYTPLVSIINSANILERVQYLNGDENIEEKYAAFDPACVIAWTALAVLFIALAYFLGKRRKTENVGSAFVLNSVFNIICALASGGYTAVVLGCSYRNGDIVSIISLIGGGIVCVIMLLLYLPKVKYLPRGVISGIGASLVVFGMCALFEKTGCFGARYLPENADKIEYVITDNFLKITEKADIERLMSMQNKVLKKQSRMISLRGGTSHEYTVKYVRTNGKTAERVFRNDFVSTYDDGPTLTMRQNEMKLENYPEYFFNSVKENNYDFSFVLFDTGKRIELPESNVDEFVELLRGEAEEKYYHETPLYAYALFDHRVSFPIQTSFGKSIEYLENYNDDIINPDKDETYLIIIYHLDDNIISMDSLSVRVPVREKNNKIVQELESYFVKEEKSDDHGEDYDIHFSIYKKAGYNSDYLIRKEDRDKVLEIMLRMIEE